MKRLINIICIIIFAVFVLLIIALKLQTIRLEGDSISGYKTSTAYFIKTDDGYNEVSSAVWHINYLLWIMTFVFAFLTAAGFIYLMVRYVFPFALRNFRK